MKLKEGFILHEVDGEYMAVATGEASKTFNGLIRNNKVADLIFHQLLKETTEEHIVKTIYETYAADKGQIVSDVSHILMQLRVAGLLDE